jgi:metal-dependent amidase/aminoacylase/carboxypeptidase family protein
VVTIGTINGGTRANIVPETVEMTGTIRTYDEAIRDQVHRDIATVTGKIAESAGAKAEVSISCESNRNRGATPPAAANRAGWTLLASMAGIQGDEQIMGRTVEGSGSRLQEPELPHGFCCSRGKALLGALVAVLVE